MVEIPKISSQLAFLPRPHFSFLQIIIYKLALYSFTMYNSLMKKIVVDKKFNNKKLIDFILYSFPTLGINTIYKALRKKDIRINGKKVSENQTIFENDEVLIYISDDVLFSNQLSIVFEDENILVLNKHTNIEVTGANSLTSIVQASYPKAMPCHRLDRNTTGLVLFAKNEDALNILLDKFKNREIEKHYICIVNGILSKKSDILNDFLFKDNKKSTVYISKTKSSGYLPITTKYKVLKENKRKNISLLDIELITGRTHQIRAHLAFIGHPILGDGKYGINEINKKFKVDKQLLCSYKIVFHFNYDSGILNYLNGKEIKISYANFEKIL